MTKISDANFSNFRSLKAIGAEPKLFVSQHVKNSAELQQGVLPLKTALSGQLYATMGSAILRNMFLRLRLIIQLLLLI